MAVSAPVPTTTPRARPAVTTVPLNSVLVLSWYTTRFWGSVTGLTSLATLPLSPVRIDCGGRWVGGGGGDWGSRG